MLRRWLAGLLLLASGAAAAQPGVLEASVAEFLRAEPKQRNVHGVAWDCLAAAELVEQGETRAARRLAEDAAELASRAVRSREHGTVVGWSNDATHRPCIQGEDSPCGGDKIVYASQTGLAVTCLADAARLLRRHEWLVPARQALLYWSKLKTRAPCRGCTYYRISDSQEDRQRYVRNMNVIMASGLAAMARATAQPGYAEQARAVVRSDLRDRDEGFRGYVGALDSTANPREKERLENHLPTMALMLERIGRALGDTPSREHAGVIWRDWALCDNRACQTRGCDYWAGDSRACTRTVTAAHCAFGGRDPQAKAACETYLSKVRTVGSYGILSLLLGRQ